MFIRVKAIQATTALLHLGPLLAGFAGFGWVMLLPFVLLFTLGLMLLRPDHFPLTYRDWQSLPVLVVALTQILTQILVVALLIALGRGFSGVLNHAPHLHGVLPLAVSLVAVSLLAVLLLALPMLRWGGSGAIPKA